MKHRCPTCKRTIETTASKGHEKSKFYPFCSERCKLIDLGAWLGEKYKIVTKTPKHESDTDESSRQR